jgi:putative addiction module killer protein
MFSIRRSPKFDTWLRRLTDREAKTRILVRLTRAEQGNLGDCKPVGEGVSEMRIDVGAGYRVYFVKQAKTVYFLLLGGDKSSQKGNIALAKSMARELKEESKS